MAKLQKHRLKSFSDTLEQIRLSTLRKKQFLQEYREVYKFPRRLTDQNIKEFTRVLKAIDRLQSFDLNKVK